MAIAAQFVFLLAVSCSLTIMPGRTEASPSETHGPIRIFSDSEFTAAKGVRSGTGTATDPYIIEDWDVSVGTTDGIRIESTLAYFVIRNVAFSGAGLYGYDGVSMAMASNGRIDSCTFQWVDVGVRGVSCKNITVSSSNVTDCRAGMRFDTSQDIAIKGNVVSLCQFGAGYQSSYRCTIAGNRIDNSSEAGIYLESSTDVNVKANVLENGQAGVQLTQSSIVIIHHNNIINNTMQGSELQGSGNYWYDPSSSEGNYWSDYGGQDADSNGIGDISYVISTNQQDRFPLMTRFSDAPPVAVVSPTRPACNTNDPLLANASQSHDALDVQKSLEFRWDWNADGIWDTAWVRDTLTAHRYTQVGTFTIALEVQDSCCNVARTTATVIVEDVAPIINIQQESGAVVHTRTVTVTWQSSDGGSGLDNFEVVLDGGNATIFGNATTSAEFSGLQNGNHTITVRAFDKAGNNASDTITFAVDAEAGLTYPLLVAGVGVLATVIGLVTYVILRNRKRNTGNQ
ncbi:MAG: right-handed parallel beta-helix repeat-containing protein [Thermoplasmata archaeon]|nr:right-handed parallel beta-helix repeat-containing protein [Thermoplasmata archaeon]